MHTGFAILVFEFNDCQDDDGLTEFAGTSLIGEVEAWKSGIYGKKNLSKALG
ncbi:hypothetical protein J43TS9_66060 [Paenibacillus cineris]|nr:hypothetical protein J43TS9_66060 [Paenibacillus cineris]